MGMLKTEKSASGCTGKIKRNRGHATADKKGQVTRLKLAPKGLSEGHIGAVTPLKTGGFVFTRDAVANPAEVYIAGKGKPARALSHANDAQLAALSRVTSARFSFKGANGDTVWGQIHQPAAVSGKLPGPLPELLPVLLLVHGGPQGSFNDSWSFRWNPRIFASQGYAVVTVDFHGSTGYGQAFTDAINRDWGGKPLEDLKLGLAAALAAHPRFDGVSGEDCVRPGALRRRRLAHRLGLGSRRRAWFLLWQ